MHDNSSGKLEIVLALAEKARADVVRFEAAGKTRIEVVIAAATELDSERVPAVSRRLRLLVSSPEYGVHPGIPPLVSPPDNLWPRAVDQQLHVFAVKNFPPEGGRDVSFDAKPFVREIRHGGFYTQGAGVEDGRAKPDPGESQT